MAPTHLFQVGEKVQNISSGKVGTVIETYYLSTGKITVSYDDGSMGKGKAKYYTLATNTTTMNVLKTVSNMMKKLLDADTQTLVKAGYVNGDLELTPAGTKALITILFVANKTALVADAQAVIDEAEKTND